MAKLSDILTSASTVRNESTSEQNTALRVGNVLYSISQYLQQYTSMADITLQVSDVGTTITAKLQSGDDRLFQKTITLPVASGEQAGILTAEAYAAFQSDISKLQQDLTALFNEKEVLEDRVNVNADNIADLGLALRGKSANSSAYYDPFISLGDSADWSEFSGKLNALSDKKYMGRCRATVSGVAVEIYQFINNFEKKDYTQVILGNVSAVGSGVTFTPNQFNIIHRHRTGVKWTAWQRINDHPIATPSLDGLMSKEDKSALEKAKTDIVSLNEKKAEKSALTTASTEISDLRYRLQGRADMSEKCSAYTDPFVSMGDIAGWPAFSEKLNAISEQENKQKYMGRCRARVDGVTVEVYHFIKSFSNNDFTQMLIGNVSADGDGVKLTYNTFNIIYRQCTGGNWTEWKRINDHPIATTSLDGLMSKEDKAALDAANTEIASLKSEKANTSELNAAKEDIVENSNQISALSGLLDKTAEKADTATRILIFATIVENVKIEEQGVTPPFSILYDKGRGFFVANKNMKFYSSFLGSENYNTTSDSRIKARADRLFKNLDDNFFYCHDGTALRQFVISNEERAKLLAYPANPLDIPKATTTQPGLMSAEDKTKLNKTKHVEEVKWTEQHSMNAYTECGEYHIHGERTNADDGLPILNANPGHTIDATLTVLDSSLTNGTGAKTDTCVTQILRMSNRTGGDGHIFIRTGQAATKSQLASGSSTSWGTWEKLMGIFEKNGVDTIEDLDGYTTNGMYSGIYAGTQPTNFYTVRFIPGDTFLMITINGYAVSNFGMTPKITQFLYKLPAKTSTSDQNAELYLRTGHWNATDKKWVWRNFIRMVTAAEFNALETRIAALEAKLK